MKEYEKKVAAYKAAVLPKDTIKDIDIRITESGYFEMQSEQGCITFDAYTAERIQAFLAKQLKEA